ncbi:hypothetical protein OQA88_2901 [Cercophora sp. LCS_1]
MAENTVYLVTGANRGNLLTTQKGIGLSLSSLLASRPNSVVIATSRRPMRAIPIPTHPTSSYITLLLDETQPSINSSTLISRLKELGITHLDVVIANAGGSSGFKNVLETKDEEAMRDFEVNAVGLVRLFGGVWALLERQGTVGERDTGKFVVIGSSVGSIGCLEEESFPGVAYGMSKAAANWFAKKVSVEFKGRLSVAVVHPGYGLGTGNALTTNRWVKTSLGQELADAVNFPEPPLSVEESAKGVLEQVCERWRSMA